MKSATTTTALPFLLLALPLATLAFPLSSSSLQERAGLLCLDIPLFEPECCVPANNTLSPPTDCQATNGTGMHRSGKDEFIAECTADSLSPYCCFLGIVGPLAVCFPVV